jgi:AcrR family transcriptional regulator
MSAAETSTPVREGGTAPSAVFRRAKPEDAIDLALATFLAEQRVDMQTLAAQLDVSPATLYRWFGSRAQLLEQVCVRLGQQFASAGRAQAQGSGDERVCDYARRVMTSSAAFEPVRSFVTREPRLALRLLLGKQGAVHRVLVRETGEIIAQTRSPQEPPVSDEHVHLIVSAATGLVWASYMIGDPPQIDSAAEMIGMILAASRAAPTAWAPKRTSTA